MANGKIITQTDNGSVIRMPGRGRYLIHIYCTGEKHIRKHKKDALELFRKLDSTAHARYMMHVNAKRLQEETYGVW